MAVSPDGKTLAAGTQEPIIRLFDTEGKNFVQLKEHTDRVKSVTFAPMARRWRREAWTAPSVSGASPPARNCRNRLSRLLIRPCFLPMQRAVLATSRRCRHQPLESAHRQLVAELTFAKPPVTALAFSADGKRVGGSGRRLFHSAAWDPNTGELLRFTRRTPCHRPAIVYAPDGKNLVSEGNDGACLWDPVSGKEKAAIRARHRRPGSFRPSRPILALPSRTALEEPALLASWTLPARNVWYAHSRLTSSPAYRVWRRSVDGKTLAINDMSGNSWLWEVETGYASLAPAAWEIPVNLRMAFTPDGRAGVLVERQPTRIVELATNKKVGANLAATADWMTAWPGRVMASFLVTATVNGTCHRLGRPKTAEGSPAHGRLTAEELKHCGSIWRNRKDSNPIRQAGLWMRRWPRRRNCLPLASSRWKPYEQNPSD